MQFSYYKWKIYKTIFISGMVVTGLIALLAGMNFSGKRKNEYLQYLTASAAMLETNSSVSMTVISRVIHDLSKNDSLSHLAAAETYQEFLYNSLLVSKQIQKTTTDLTAINYEVSVMMQNPPVIDGQEMNYVISSKSTNSLPEFLNINSGMTMDMIHEMNNYFQNNRTPLLLPQYENGILKNFYYFASQTIDQQPFIFMLTIPKYTLLGESSSLCTLIYDQNQVLAIDSSGDFSIDSAALYDRLIQDTGQTGPFYFNNHPVVTTSIAGSPWKAAYVYHKPNYGYSDLYFFLILVFLFLVIGFFIMKYVSDQLYKPVKEVLTDMVPVTGSTFINNEFELIRQNNSKMQTLSQELQEMAQANNNLISQQSYQELLFSSNIKPDYYASLLDPEESYCVARFELNCDEEDISVIPIQKGILYNASSLNPAARYVSVDQNHCCLILCCRTLPEARELIFTFLHSITSPENLENTEPYVALSNLYSGSGILHKCYLETLKIQSYRSLFPTAKIISYEQISPWDKVSYSYPLATENKLIQYTIDGKAEALQLLRSLIRENIQDKNLPTSAMQNLIYALIGTVIRIFGELKTTPEEYLDESIDFKYYYDNWNSPGTISMIRTTVEKIIETVNKLKSTSNQKLRHEMLQYIYDNYWDNIMLNDMADHFNISAKYCGILFKELSDDNFKNFLNRYRIDRAKEMLNENPSIKIQDLCGKVGFNSPNSFLRVFRKYTGLTPTEYLSRMVEDYKSPY